VRGGVRSAMKRNAIGIRNTFHPEAISVGLFIWIAERNAKKHFPFFGYFKNLAYRVRKKPSGETLVKLCDPDSTSPTGVAPGTRENVLTNLSCVLPSLVSFI
jgi:hypothetical protein